MSPSPDLVPLPLAPRERIAFSKLWGLLRPYWFSDERWAGRGLLALVVGLNLASVFVTVLLAQWNRRFYDALQGKDYPVFLSLLGWFGVLAVIPPVQARSFSGSNMNAATSGRARWISTSGRISIATSAPIYG